MTNYTVKSLEKLGLLRIIETTNDVVENTWTILYEKIFMIKYIKDIQTIKIYYNMRDNSPVDNICLRFEHYNTMTDVYEILVNAWISYQKVLNGDDFLTEKNNYSNMGTI